MTAKLRRESGFTILELLVVLAIVGIAALIGMPALLNYLEQQKLIGSAREAATLMRLARIEAIKRSVRAGVKVDYADNKFVAFADFNDNKAPDDGEVIGTSKLPNGVALWGPTDVDDGGVNASSGFDEDAARQGVAMFIPDGSAALAGAFRLKGDADNYLEVRLEPRTTGRVHVQRWFGGDPESGANWYENGEAGNDWEWDDVPDGDPDG